MTSVELPHLRKQSRFVVVSIVAVAAISSEVLYDAVGPGPGLCRSVADDFYRFLSVGCSTLCLRSFEATVTPVPQYLMASV